MRKGSMKRKLELDIPALNQRKRLRLVLSIKLALNQCPKYVPCDFHAVM